MKNNKIQACDIAYTPPDWTPPTLPTNQTFINPIVPDNSKDFIMWLKGYIDATGEDVINLLEIKAKLEDMGL